MSVKRALSGQRQLVINTENHEVRVWIRTIRQWPNPFSFLKLGIICFGIGPIGVNVFPR